MSDDEQSVVVSAVGGSACPQADDTQAPGIALGTTRSTTNALRTPMNREKTAHTTAKTSLSLAPARRSPWPAVVPRLRDEGGFTLVELLVSVSVLVLLVFLATQLINSAATVTVLGYKRMDADSEARQVLDRMGFDFAQMVKRSDADYYVKSSSGTASDCGVCGPQTGGNDQAAFYSSVPGYYPATSLQSPISLVAYRVNSNSASSSYNKLERMVKGLLWNGASASPTPAPVVFLPQTIGGPQPPGPPPGNWPSAVSPTATDSSYEVIGPQVFRFEYYYLLQNGNLLSTPWYAVSSVRGMQDVAAIVVVIAVIDPKSKVLVTDCQLAQLDGAPFPAGCSTPAQYPVLIDWGNTTCAGCPSQTDWQTKPGLLLAQWSAALDANISPNGIRLPPSARAGIRVYERYFYFTH